MIFGKKAWGIASESTPPTVSARLRDETQHPIRALCQALEVSAQWLLRLAPPPNPAGPPCPECKQLLEQIIHLHEDSRETYGSPRVQCFWRRAGHAHGRNRIARLMRPEGRPVDAPRGRFRVPHHGAKPPRPSPSPRNRLEPIRPLPAPSDQIWSGTSLTSPRRKAGSICAAH